ncbi:nucleoside-diphosphate sugar epimerase/dehydratase [Methylotenera sp. 1P/1]|uniref:polysaccharide biosynthesis protein n=1 Tax=Methylotenera sp. 1P/1 TaxID=1131551 RepID=UPI00036E5F80|nr:nucleoside-diphosphate sugar epimerase/dehydratase [Methylotenera sp. 1P/1]
MNFYRQYIVRWLSYIAMMHDLIVASAIWYFAFLLRFNFAIPPNFIDTTWTTLPAVLAIEFVCFVLFGLYRGMWRFASIPDLKRIIRAVALSALIISFASLIAQPQIIIPRSVLFLNPLLLVLIMGGSRFAYRAWKERRLFNPIVQQGKPVIVLGVEEAAINLIKELTKSHEWRVVALLDDNTLMHNREFMHIRVEGAIDALPEVAQKYDCEHCIIAMPSANHLARKHAVNVANSIAMEVLTLPAMSDLMSGKVSISQVRKVDVEDLLGRDVVNLDNAGLSSMIASNTVMVSGAAGSIGSELCRQVLAYHPKKLVCIDVSEYALYLLQQEFSQRKTDTQILYIVADIKNKTRINHVLLTHQPKLVLHAAAYKHVPMMEDFNVTEALINNAFGTYQFASACQTAQVDKFVLISTDKAVNPTNVMGASKRLAELVCQSLQPKKPSKNTPKTQFITVRFGNVLGSSGSVIPKFREQIARGGPITITHPEITRYFMSIPEAAQLVLQAGTMGKGGEIFVLDMGEPVKIIDLAKDMIKLSGLHHEEIRIEFTGLRPGEKLYEELLADDENTLPTNHEKLRIAQARSASAAWLDDLLHWLEKVQHMAEHQVKVQLKDWVEEYQPNALTAGEPPVLAIEPSQTIH